MEHHFHLKEGLIELWLFRFEYLTDVFSKINEVSKERNEPYLLPMIKFEFLGKKLEFKKLVSTTVSLTASQYLVNFLKRYVVILTYVIFWMFLNGRHQHLEYLHNSVHW